MGIDKRGLIAAVIILLLALSFLILSVIFYGKFFLVQSSFSGHVTLSPEKNFSSGIKVTIDDDSSEERRDQNNILEPD